MIASLTMKMKVTRARLVVLVLIIGGAHVVASDALYGNETGRLSLLEFKKAISLDPQQVLISWNDSIHFCNWEGVGCRMRNPRRVISLNLTNRGLIGHISPSLGNLTFLRHLFLPTNGFTGELPPSLGHLHRLQSLYLSNNTLQGRIPPSLANCSSLQALSLDHNQLVGKIPLDLPPNLQELNLLGNSLTGNIPASLANITTLQEFNCGYNSIEGNIPNEFAQLHKLQILQAGANMLTGRFPQAILNLSTLVGLQIYVNDLSGEIPSDLGNYLPNLQVILLDSNFFHGKIPSSLTNASKLYRIDISGNNFTGLVPSTIGRLNKLTWLNLEENKLQARNKEEWEFMNSLANCSELYAFSVEKNHLEGHVPKSLGNLSAQLHHLYLGRNQLTWAFPPGIANLPNLIVLQLYQNQFTDPIPQWLGALTTLQKLDLSQNSFTGSIPSSLSNLSRLAYLILDNNQFVGKIPKGLGNLQTLQILVIAGNKLHGRIPNEIFSIPTIVQIGLSFNNLDGQLPTNIGNAKQLIRLILSYNKLSGNISTTLGDCQSLQHIKLDSNNFTGSIPTSLGKATSLVVVNFSSNDLTGSIPSSLGNLKLLQILDLSFNHLEGEVPSKGIFKNATATRIDGNKGLCGGSPELHLLTCHIAHSNGSRHKLFIVLKIVVPSASIMSLVIVVCLLLFQRGKKEKKSISLPSFGREFPKVSFNDLARATEGFSASNLIGRGRYSYVYQGRLFEDRRVVAIKVIKQDVKGAHKSFIAECNVLRNVRHRNLVSILTACSSTDAKGDDFKALVYEFMPRGDLHTLLHCTRDDGNTLPSTSHIELVQRLSIVVDVADALEYLHHNNQGTIIHCDNAI